MTKRSFKVGDRVCVYATLMGNAVRSEGTLLHVYNEDCTVKVRLDKPTGGNSTIYAHMKQCRLLKPKAAPKVRVTKHIEAWAQVCDGTTTLYTFNPKGMIAEKRLIAIVRLTGSYEVEE